MFLDTLEMARWTRGIRLEGPVTDSDAGSRAVHQRPVRGTTRRTRLDTVDRNGRGSLDIALAETVNGLYKTELIRGPDQGP
jgi:hypothetical protein